MVTDAYVSADSGVGIVHQAPAFGEHAALRCAVHAALRCATFCCAVCAAYGLAAGLLCACCARQPAALPTHPRTPLLLSSHPPDVPVSPLPAGEDDYRVCLSNGVIAKGEGIPCPLDDSGCFTDPVADFKGQYCKASGCLSLLQCAVLGAVAFHWPSTARLMQRFLVLPSVRILAAVAPVGPALIRHQSDQ